MSEGEGWNGLWEGSISRSDAWDGSAVEREGWEGSIDGRESFIDR